MISLTQRSPYGGLIASVLAAPLPADLGVYPTRVLQACAAMTRFAAEVLA
jgi:hypothetical protein